MMTNVSEEGSRPAFVVHDYFLETAFELRFQGLLRYELVMRVPDCQAAYEVLRSRGAEFLTPPVDWGYEVRAFLRDPDGHLLEISQSGQPRG